MILKPRLSTPSIGLDLAPSPEMINASFGSATRQTILNSTINTMMATTTAIATAAMGMRPPPRSGDGFAAQISDNAPT